jgi:hypothetical protein
LWPFWKGRSTMLGLGAATRIYVVTGATDNGELKAPSCEQGGQDLVDRAGLPEPFKDQGGADPGATGGDAVAPGMAA